MRKAEINVTPLIDILLVMLVIFIATVTLKQQAIESHLPPPPLPAAEPPPGQIMIEVAADRRLSVNSQAVTRPQLETFLRGIYDQRGDKTLYVAGAGSLPYGAVIDVMDAAKGAGVQRFGIDHRGDATGRGVRPN